MTTATTTETFEVGDRVRWTEDLDALRDYSIPTDVAGLLGTVEWTNNASAYRIRTDDYPRSFYCQAGHLSRVDSPEAEPEFKVGDEVEILASSHFIGDARGQVGQTGRITAQGNWRYPDGTRAWHVNTGGAWPFHYPQSALKHVNVKGNPEKEPLSELEAFKKKVAEVALREKRSRGWCGELDDVLEELELELPTRRVKVTMTVDIGTREATAEGVAYAMEDFDAYDIRRHIESVEAVE